MADQAKETLNKALHQLSYGYYILATRADASDLKTRKEDWVSAGTVSWATQSSFEPPLITVAIQKDSDLNETIQKSQVFSLTVIGKDEKELIKKFAEDSKVDYSDNKVNGVSYKEGKTGAPLLDCGVATLECTLEDALTTDGDHLLFVGRIKHAFTSGGDPITEREVNYEYAGTSPRK
ncbi:flavin reductase family protein [Neolewinella antarctica]|uniref:Flavin reductase (DIM6/NTAB) family NADH-FMN oxidoreductase RutF n=1 Tax=Neolewinella antarctica TaxID=442734 RepID=A0ABX0XEP2_9BACT|nr:flavin reductase family protein [Neolewinella antarctica]NJC27790.1 flavin reductase (DIM6/NTAB) family NADH-FMN oxidoreductase RutF [Neolewinella antarctica]